ncbi:unnamed protein product [Adineta steineri]|uniref:Uncharacterized protein n=2 Tax=Adineta steineri TaxID=433720 RepID=A0A814J855_9BILA|nr:unnamed protein product [Adineta steineri]CAF1033910.1 unnamed protein product [Adineta steineri]
MVQDVKRMNKHVTPVNTLIRAQREFRMMLRAPKYHFRIAFVIFVLFKIAEPLKISVIKRINGRSIRVIPSVI